MSHELQAIPKPAHDTRSLPDAVSSVDKLEGGGDHVETLTQEEDPPSYTPEEERRGGYFYAKAAVLIDSSTEDGPQHAAATMLSQHLLISRSSQHWCR